MKIAIVIVNYNTPADTIECLESLKKTKLPQGIQLETTIVDNASRDDSVDLIYQKYPEVKLITSSRNLGFAGGNNLGIKAALTEKPDWVMLLNPDTIIDQDFFVDLLSSNTLSDPKVGIVCPLIYFAAGYEFHKKRYTKSDLGKVIWYAGGQIDWNNIYASHKHVDEVDHGQFSQPVETDFATGACLIVKTSVLKQVGFLNESYFLYLEDLEFNQRVKNHGWKVMFDPKPKLWHKVSQSSGGIGSSLNDYFITRNRLLFGMSYASLRTKLALLKEAVKLSYSGTDTQKLAIKDFVLHRYGKGSFLK